MPSSTSPSQAAVDAFFAAEKPDYVFLAAAKVGGILANNTYPAEFIRDNLAIQTNVIHAAWKNGVKRLLFLGSSCIYPKLAPQPMKEEYLLTGPLEPTNRPYALAKIAGIEMCWSYNRQYGTQIPRRHADQSVRPGRQLPPGKFPRHPGADPQVSRSQGRATGLPSRSGAPARPGGNFSTATTWPMPACF